MKKNITFWVLILAVVGCFGIVSCSSDSGTSVSGDSSKTSSSQSGVSCKQVGIGNYMATFSRCSDDQIWAMLCRNRDNAYQCVCKKGATEVKTETLDTKPYEITMKDIPLLHKNATAATNKICGFNITLNK